MVVVLPAGIGALRTGVRIGQCLRGRAALGVGASLLDDAAPGVVVEGAVLLRRGVGRCKGGRGHARRECRRMSMDEKCCVFKESTHNQALFLLVIDRQYLSVYS